MSDRLRGKVALVTGAARGMGAAAVRRLAAEGASVLATDVLEQEVEALADELERVTSRRHDVTLEVEWRDAVAAAEKEFGALHVLVNNAGILTFGRVEEMPLEDYRRLVDVNQVGVFLGMKAAVPAIERAGGGSIVNISSVEGLGGGPFLVAYTASKFAVRGMTKAAAIELGGRGIRVNSVHPGAIDTEMVRQATGGSEDANRWMAKQTALNRMGSPDEVAALIAFLASDDSSYCTGAEFIVDGGVIASSGFKGR